MADEASLTRPPLTSCFVARFLTGSDQYWSVARWLGTPALVHYNIWAMFSLELGWDLWEKARYISELENPSVCAFLKVATAGLPWWSSG